MSFLGRCLAVVITTGLFFVMVTSAQPDGDTCMSRWLILSDISNKSVPSYEASLKSLMLDEDNYHHSSKKQVVPFLLHRHPKDRYRFLQCIEKRFGKCRHRAPCGVGGKCLLNTTTSYYCKCRRGYTGSFCQEDVDECKSLPCFNKGTCHDHINKFTCTCMSGFKGKTCNQDINECLSNPCKNNGTCFDEVNAFACRCPIEYEGKTCEKRWFNSKLFKTLNREHADILGKLENESAAIEAQLNRLAKKINVVLEPKSSSTSQTTTSQTTTSQTPTSQITTSQTTTSQTPTRQTTYGNYSCLDIKTRDGQSRDGFYWIKPPRYSGSPYRAYCDMTTQGGGWTLFATKVSPTFVFQATSFSPASASSTTSNAKGCILPGTQWSEVLFRFGPNSSPVQVIYSREGGRASTGKTHFNKFLECAVFNESKYVDGFIKYTPRVNGGGRTPQTGYHGFAHFHYYTLYGITFNCNDNNQNYLSLWTVFCGSSKYDFVDNSDSRMRKCIAGYCYLNRPVWLMYR